MAWDEMTWRRAPCLAILASLLVAVILPGLSHATTSHGKGQIAFTRRVRTIMQVFTVKPDGTELRQVTHGRSAGEHGLAWSPNGHGLLYTLGRIDGTDRIVKSHADGSGAVVISPACTGTCLSDDDPSYSPDGTKIAFERTFGPAANQTPTRVAILTMNADGSHLTQLTEQDTAPSTADSQPQWSPDGTKIAFVRTSTTAKPNNKGAIMIMNADGSNVHRITPFAIDATNPQWSPDGKHLLFNTYAHPTQFKSANLFTMRADGTHRVALTHYRGGVMQAFADGWSPDGRQVLFRRMAFSGNSTEVGGYYILIVRVAHIKTVPSTRIRPLNSVRLHYDARAAWGRNPVTSGTPT
jgi:Tol biopolymer transport system component